GQSFDGLQISRQLTQTITITVAGMQLPPTQLMDTVNWELARGVGPVRGTSTQGDVMELVSYFVP
ncbi:MAG: hypothetical protein RMK99_11805, partial [Anaerolineales bacterium]|nr:hypothetical protein [Anaerolineales bacterium]